MALSSGHRLRLRHVIAQWFHEITRHFSSPRLQPTLQGAKLTVAMGARMLSL
jgi:hypothetical protein